MGIIAVAPYKIRRAKAGDAAGVAQVHVQAWQECYGGILPPEVIQQRPFDIRLKQRMDLYARPRTDWLYLVLCDEDDRPVGFCDAKLPGPGDEPGTGEFLAIYLLASAGGQGNGRQLMRRAAQWLIEHGCQRAVVDVLADNHAARTFYQRLGAVEVGATTCKVQVLAEFDSVTYKFNSFSKLLGPPS